MITKGIFLTQLNKIITEFDLLKSKSKYDDLSDITNRNIEDINKLVSNSKATIARITGINSEYYKDVCAALDTNKHYGTKLRLVIGVVKALTYDLENDYLKNLHSLIQSDVFSDYLDMASYLLSEGYKDPAAVIIGSTLEVHIRELCKTNSIDTETENNKGKMIAKKADAMNTDLAKGSIYSSAYQKQVTAWLDIRNSAAHGHYSKYSEQEIKLMLDGIRQFILLTT